MCIDTVYLYINFLLNLFSLIKIYLTFERHDGTICDGNKKQNY